MRPVRIRHRVVSTMVPDAGVGAGEGKRSCAVCFQSRSSSSLFCILFSDRGKYEIEPRLPVRFYPLIFRTRLLPFFCCLPIQPTDASKLAASLLPVLTRLESDRYTGRVAAVHAFHW